MKLPEDHRVFPLEEQYETAAWDSTIRSLSHLWTEAVFHINANSIPESVKELAKTAFKDPSEILMVAEQAKAAEYPADFIELGILVKNRNRELANTVPFITHGSLSLMHELHYADKSVLHEIASDANVSRFEQDVSTLALYHQARLRHAAGNSISLVETIRNMHHDNIFYIGKWDNDRSLGLDPS